MKDALARRLKSLMHPRWTEAMTVLVKGKKHFRWHDSGDIQSVKHLINIFEVCKNTPATKHWLPTQERKYLPMGSYPDNLVIRLSNAKNDTVPGQAWTHWSTVVTHADAPMYGATRKLCQAPEQGMKCGSCRACWNKDVKEIHYRKH